MALTPSFVAILPAERWLLYAWLLPGKQTKDLFLARPDGSDAHAIALDMGGEHADSCIEAFQPVWSTDGTKLAFVCYVDDDTSTIQVLDPSTGSLQELVRVFSPEFIDSPPSWSPDGQSLAFDVIRWDPSNTFIDGSLIATVTTNGGAIDRGGAVDRLTQFGTFAAAPSWSPDGTLSAFNTFDIGNTHGIEEASNLYTVQPDGTQTRLLTGDSVNGQMRIGQPHRSPDASQIWVSVIRDWETGPSGGAQIRHRLGRSGDRRAPRARSRRKGARLRP